ncbi:phospho-acceptor domain-containing protein [Alicyclobacillus sacchari]|uniref:histidine kinase n=1 Tax=Alicyclobacillus sacchari TaxID=392010 RepID=A0A4R8LJH4_9BACL|nr:HAMP domain-containing sensor histidine kinase [Alicyclobacillus sacchari]TDY42422.1 phospho-acceptor domain-containing protein [Alicyclobacillus sacchari]
MDLFHFWIDLVCVVLPLLVLDAWHLRSALPPTRTYQSPYVAGPLFVTSAIASNYFSFHLGPSIMVNFSIVPLTFNFFLLSPLWSLFWMLVYIVVQTAVGVYIIGHGHISSHSVGNLVHILPKSLAIVIVYVGLMMLCSYATRSKNPYRRSYWFALVLFLYASLDYAIVQHDSDLIGFHVGMYITYVLGFIALWLICVRFVFAVQAIDATKSAAKTQEQYELIGQLAASMAHEIRNPITVVRGFAQLMAHHPETSETHRTYLETIMAELDQADAMIASYLQLSQMGSDEEKSQISLKAVVDHACNLLGPYAQSHAVMLHSDCDERAVVLADRDGLLQCAIHLIKNAIESHDRAGNVDVSTRCEGKWIIWRVADDGRGMDAKTLKRIGQPHYTTRSRGTGLGLTFVYKMVHELGGTIEVTSEINRGTTFVVRIPRAHSAATRGATRGIAPAQP